MGRWAEGDGQSGLSGPGSRDPASAQNSQAHWVRRRAPEWKDQAPGWVPRLQLECRTPWPPHFGLPILGLPSSASRQLDHLLRISVCLSAICRHLPGGCEGAPFSRRPPPTLKSALTLSPVRSGQPRPPASSGTRNHRAGAPLLRAELTEGGRGAPDKGEVQGPHLQGAGVDAAGETGSWDTLPGKRA